MQWGEFVAKITGAQSAKTISPQDTHAAHSALGVDSFSMLISRNELWPQILTTLGVE